MKLTKSQLKQIIKEELEEVLKAGTKAEKEYGVATIEPETSLGSPEEADWGWDDVKDVLMDKLGAEAGAHLAGLAHQAVKRAGRRADIETAYANLAKVLGIEVKYAKPDIYKENKS